MPALSYKERFVDPVLAGLRGDPDGKRQSIRNFRKRPIKVGERIVHYFAQRTKWCKYLGESICKDVFVIHITKQSIYILENFDFQFVNWNKIRALKNQPKEIQRLTSPEQLNEFAKLDGFKDFEDMKAFWQEEHGRKKKKRSPFPYTGNLYKW